MKFRTEYTASAAPFALDPSKPVVLTGSCFSQNMAQKMNDHLWTALNPLGTLYNPFSIGKALELMLMPSQKADSEFKDSLFFFNGIWNSELFDSSFSSRQQEDCLKEFRHTRQVFIDNLQSGEALIVTFGTAICYFTSEKEWPVGNCHKQPAKLFTRRRLSTTEIVSYWQHLIEKLLDRIPNLKIIFTVSPVRHLKDGFTGNACSKATLQLAVEEICNKFPSCHYFPAFEILTDDLRDYRFYASDLVHPSEEAIEYLWMTFLDTFIDAEGKELLERGARIMKARMHRPKTGALGLPLS